MQNYRTVGATCLTSTANWMPVPVLSMMRRHVDPILPAVQRSEVALFVNF